MIFIYGYAITFDLNNIKIGILDYSNSEISEKLIKKFLNNGYFSVVNPKISGKGDIVGFEKMLKDGTIREYIIIPYDFSKKIKNLEQTELSFIIDGSDSNSANIIYQYSESVLMDFISEFQDIKKFMNISTKIYFNPALKSSSAVNGICIAYISEYFT